MLVLVRRELHLRTTVRHFITDSGLVLDGSFHVVGITPRFPYTSSPLEQLHGARSIQDSTSKHLGCWTELTLHLRHCSFLRRERLCRSFTPSLLPHSAAPLNHTPELFSTYFNHPAFPSVYYYRDYFLNGIRHSHYTHDTSIRFLITK